MNQTEIAKKLGISQSAVSLVLNDPATARVSEEKKTRIIHYLRSNRNLNSAGRKRTWNIGYVTDPLQNLRQDFFQESLRGIEEETAGNHYNLMLECFHGKELSLLRRGKVDGLIIRSGPACGYLESDGCPLPVVLLNCAMESPFCDTVMPDNRGGLFKIVRFLAGKGCRKAAFLGSRPDYSPYSCNYRERKDGFLEACAVCGVDPMVAEIELPVGCPDRLDLLERVLNRWKKLGNPPQAIVAVNHFYAVIAQRLWPEILVVAGDNKMEKGFENPGIPMLVQDAACMGKLAAELLMKRIADPARKKIRINCDVELHLSEKSEGRKSR